MAEAENYVQSVVNNLYSALLSEVYPQLVEAFYRAEPDAGPDEIQQAALTLLYRLLFLMCAEDRRLLPVGDANYDRVSLRSLRRPMAPPK